MSDQRNTYTLLPDVPGTYHDRPNVEELQEEYLKQKIGEPLMSELTKKMWRDDMIISRGMVYGKELDEYVWKQVEKAAIKGFFAGALVMCIIWMIVLGI